MFNKSLAFPAVIVSLLFAFWFSSCVPSRQFEDLQKKEKNCQDENAKLKSDNQDLNVKNTELKAEIERLDKDIKALVKDSTESGFAYRRLNDLYHQLTTSYDKLLSNNDKLLAGSNEETRKLIAQLNDTRSDLQKKEDELKAKQQMLADRESNLDQLKKDLKEREDKVAELQSILTKKDSSVKALKDAVTNALLGFQNNGLTVEQKNGKVYVSMEERLLFASGSTHVETRGEEALKQLAVVLGKNKDINVLVEGHTDDVPINGTLPSGAKDNWELSVLRATSVTKIILTNASVEPSRITAAGRGEFFPLDPSKTVDARKKNRRTEIILTPKLDELLKVLDTH